MPSPFPNYIQFSIHNMTYIQLESFHVNSVSSFVFNFREMNTKNQRHKTFVECFISYP